MGKYRKLLAETEEYFGRFAKESPAQITGFSNFMKAVEAKGALDAKQKELIAIGCSVVSHCEKCISFHVDAALKAGAKREEILESAWVAVLMGGGPALMYAQCVLEALDEFK